MNTQLLSEYVELMAIDSGYKYTARGMVRFVDLPMDLEKEFNATKEELFDALHAQNLHLDTRLSQITAPVRDYLMVIFDGFGYSVVKCEAGDEQTLACDKKFISTSTAVTTLNKYIELFNWTKDCFVVDSFGKVKKIG